MPKIKSKSKPKKRRSYKQASLSAVLLSLLFLVAAWLQESYTSYPLPAADQPAMLFANQVQSDLRGTYTHAIGSAQQSVLLIVYSLSDSQILKALKQKSEEGVPVWVVCDAEASPYAQRHLGDKVKLHLHTGKGLMHQKILVIDENKVWLGSANMTQDSLRMHGNLVTAFEHPQAAAWIQERSMALFNGQPIKRPQPLHIPLKDQHAELYILPDADRAVDRVKELIASAKKSVRVAMFTFTRMDLANALSDARGRGLKVEVVVDRNSSLGASKEVVAFLKKRKIPTFISRGKGLMHHKFLYVDESTLVNGSSNWTKAAFTQNADCYMILSPLGTEQRECMERLWHVLTTDADRV